MCDCIYYSSFSPLLHVQLIEPDNMSLPYLLSNTTLLASPFVHNEKFIGYIFGGPDGRTVSHQVQLRVEPSGFVVDFFYIPSYCMRIITIVTPALFTLLCCEIAQFIVLQFLSEVFRLYIIRVSTRDDSIKGYYSTTLFSPNIIKARRSRRARGRCPVRVGKTS